ncbi:MAG: hypothetical protein ABJQ71_13940 [Roseibium sp.]
MTYDVKLIDADIKDAMLGKMRLGLDYEDGRVAELEYDWTSEHFTAVFHGHAPSMPKPAHPVLFLQKPITAIRSLMTADHTWPTDVFKDHQVTIEVE